MKLKTFKLFNENILAQAGNSELHGLAQELISTSKMSDALKELYLNLFNKDESVCTTENDVKASIQTFEGLNIRNVNNQSYKHLIDFIVHEGANTALINDSIIFVYKNENKLSTTSSRSRTCNIFDMFGDSKIGRVGYIGLGNYKFALYGIDPNLESLVIENKNDVYFVVYNRDSNVILHWNKNTNELTTTERIEDLSDNIDENNPKINGRLNSMTQEEINNAITYVKNIFDDKDVYKYKTKLTMFHYDLDINWTDFEDREYQDRISKTIRF